MAEVTCMACGYPMEYVDDKRVGARFVEIFECTNPNCDAAREIEVEP